MLAAGGIPIVSLFGLTDPAKFAPWARDCRVLRAQAWGTDEMDAIPVGPVVMALETSLSSEAGAAIRVTRPAKTPASMAD
jgi:hypothetical protein